MVHRDEKKFLSSWHGSTVVVKPTHPQLVLFKTVLVRGIIGYLMTNFEEACWDGVKVALKIEGMKTWDECWITDEDTTEHDAGSFSWYCRRLNMNPLLTRTRLMNPDYQDEIRKIAKKAEAIMKGGSGREDENRAEKLEERIIRILKEGREEPEPRHAKKPDAATKDHADLVSVWGDGK